MKNGAPQEYNRSLITLCAWARKALEPELIEIARNNSPNASFNLASQMGKPQTIARATRWLSMIRRDHGDEAFETYVQQNVL